MTSFQLVRPVTREFTNTAKELSVAKTTQAEAMKSQRRSNLRNVLGAINIRFVKGIHAPFYGRCVLKAMSALLQLSLLRDILATSTVKGGIQ